MLWTLIYMLYIAHLGRGGRAHFHSLRAIATQIRPLRFTQSCYFRTFLLATVLLIYLPSCPSHKQIIIIKIIMLLSRETFLCTMWHLPWAYSICTVYVYSVQCKISYVISNNLMSVFAKWFQSPGDLFSSSLLWKLIYSITQWPCLSSRFEPGTNDDSAVWSSPYPCPKFQTMSSLNRNNIGIIY